MLEGTREVAELLPVEIFQDFSEYLKEINDSLVTIASEIQRPINDDLVLEVELVFLIRFLQIHFLDSERNYLDLIQFFQDLGLSGFEYGGTFYDSSENLDAANRQFGSYLDLREQLNRSLRQLIEDTNTANILNYQSDAQIIRRIISGN